MNSKQSLLLASGPAIKDWASGHNNYKQWCGIFFCSLYRRQAALQSTGEVMEPRANTTYKAELPTKHPQVWNVN